MIKVEWLPRKVMNLSGKWVSVKECGDFREQGTCRYFTHQLFRSSMQSWFPEKYTFSFLRDRAKVLFEDFLLTSTGIGWTNNLSKYWQGPKGVLLCTRSLGLSWPWSLLAITGMNLLTIRVILFKAEKNHSNKNVRNIKKSECG